jgi:hypothetical protein
MRAREASSDNDDVAEAPGRDRKKPGIVSRGSRSLQLLVSRGEVSTTMRRLHKQGCADQVPPDRNSVIGDRLPSSGVI